MGACQSIDKGFHKHSEIATSDCHTKDNVMAERRMEEEQTPLNSSLITGNNDRQTVKCPKYKSAKFNYDEVILETCHPRQFSVKELEIVKKEMQVCPKYGGQHKKFYNTEQSLMPENLPLAFQDALQLITVLCDQTCLIKISHTSPNRPVDLQYKSTDRMVERRGSGVIHINGINTKEVCRSDSTLTNATGHHDGPFYGPFRIKTAKHVVYDEQEMRYTVISLYFDIGDRKEDFTLIPLRFAALSDDDDCVELECVTCDERLGGILKKIETKRNVLWQEFISKLKTKMIDDKCKEIPEILAVCISHIHGSPDKHISIGRCCDTPAPNKIWHTFIYDTPTCLGSSGAPVWLCSKDASFYACVPHSYAILNSLGRSALGAVHKLPASTL